MVVATFKELGRIEPQSVSRTAFLEKGFFAGLQFGAGNLRAIWYRSGAGNGLGRPADRG